MANLIDMLKKLVDWSQEDGQDLTEYALLILFIAVAAVGAVALIAPQLLPMYNSMTNALQP